jgi:hypothetical protein
MTPKKKRNLRSQKMSRLRRNLSNNKEVVPLK